MPEKIKVLYDHQIYSSQEFGGISRLFMELIRDFKQKDVVEPHLSLIYSNNDYLPEIGINKFFFRGKRFPGKKKIIEIINKTKSCFDILFSKYDIVHPTYYDPYFLSLLNGKPFVLTVHDMAHERYPEYVSASDNTSEWKKKLIMKAEHIIAISEATKRELLSIYDLDESKITVIYHATSLKPIKKPLELDLPKEYILYSGNRKGYKNFINMIKGIASLLKEKNIYLVCAGGGEFSDEEKKLISKLGVEDNVIQKNFHTNEELATFYHSAIMFIFPSKYEGFGIPLLESMSCHCPLVISDIDVFKEIVKDAAMYFDPDDPKSINRAVKKIYEDKNLRKKLIKIGDKKILDYSWEKTARNTEMVYNKIKMNNSIV